MTLGLAVGVVVIVYLIIELLKKTVAKTDRQQDYLPFAGILLGIFISLAIYAFDKNMQFHIYVGDSLISAILTGAGSGLVATGGNQMFKKINKLAKGDYEGISDDIDNVVKQVNELLEDEDSDDE